MSKGEGRLQCPQCYTLNPDESRFCTKCGSSLSDIFETLTLGAAGQAAPEAAAHLVPGQIFDRRYRIIEEIGRGGMGRVFKAEDIELGITVALKIIRPRLSSDPRFIERFKKEMLLARAISHENIIRIYDLGEAGGTKYISMEYIRGEDLKEFLHTAGTLSLETIVRVARQIAEAVRVAHAKGIVHQDLKPSNIMVDHAGRVYVMDFGLAKAVHGAAAGQGGEGGGTPQYMSPEQAGRGQVGPASDIYSFGAVLYEIATGRAVFEAETRAEYQRKHSEEKPSPPSRVNPRLPKPLEHIILKCLEKDPAGRYQSMTEALADLDRIEVGPGTSSILSWLGRRWAYLAAPVLLAGVAWLAWALFVKPPPLPSGKRLSVAIMYLKNNSGDKTLDPMGRTLSELLIADLLQSRYVNAATGDRIYEILKSLGLLGAPAFSSAELRNVGNRAKADFLVEGSFTRVNGVLRIDTFLRKLPGLELVKAFRDEGNEAGIFAMVESLNQKVKENLGLPGEALAGDIHKDLRKITTSSPEAFRHFVEGKSLFNEQKFEESVVAMEKAVALDPEFAMAYLALADDFMYLRNGEKYTKNLAKAQSLLNRVSDREYYMIQAASAAGLQEQIEILKKLLGFYPDDADALGSLGAAYRNMEAWDLAAAEFEKIPVEDRDELVHENLAMIYSARGEYVKALNLLEVKTWREAYAAFFGMHVRLATTYLFLRRFDQALAEARKARVVDPTDFEPPETEGIVQMIKGDAPAAARGFQEMTASSDPFFQVNGRLWLGHAMLLQGKYGQLKERIGEGLGHALKAGFQPELRAAEIYAMSLLLTHERLRARDLAGAYDASSRALEAAQDSERADYIELALQFRGTVLARMKRFDEAALIAAKMKETVARTEVPNAVRYVHLLQGQIARERGDLDGAIASFRTAVSLLPSESYKTDLHILFVDALASALFEKGDLEGARAAYEKVSAMTLGRVRWGDLYVLSYYQLGRIHQAKKERGQAAGAYRKFLELWSGADADLPEVADARRQLAALGVHPAP